MNEHNTLKCWCRWSIEWIDSSTFGCWLNYHVKRYWTNEESCRCIHYFKYFVEHFQYSAISACKCFDIMGSKSNLPDLLRLHFFKNFITFSASRLEYWTSQYLLSIFRFTFKQFCNMHSWWVISWPNPLSIPLKVWILVLELNLKYMWFETIS